MSTERHEEYMKRRFKEEKVSEIIDQVDKMASLDTYKLN